MADGDGSQPDKDASSISGDGDGRDHECTETDPDEHGPYAHRRGTPPRRGQGPAPAPRR